MDSGNMGDPDHTGHTDHATTDHTGHTDQAITQVASEESSKPKNGLVFMPAARTTRARSAQFRLRRDNSVGTTLHQGCNKGGSNFGCGANYPHQAIKGGYFVFVWGVET